ncbi:peptidase domain-containing ABC transporter [Pedobacter nototheniae]|uniref:peptidase domain-containing ABC transporter n=1 Tax=Pedobacter nototheniae TaxID=2488994 RepID=UPI00292F49D9|nr:peptidase domain-containing ABC transporter [Pedobacter nototheniae]
MLRYRFPFYKQFDSKDCGPTCIRMIAKFYGKDYSLQTLREKGNLSKEGISINGISKIGEHIGFRSLAVKVDFEKLKAEAPLPAIAHWNQNHFIVIYKITDKKVYAADPSFGLISYSHEEFLRGWGCDIVQGKEKGILLLLDPTPDFFSQKGEATVNKANISFILKYLMQFKKSLMYVCISLLVGCLLQLVFPFLTQSIIDYGIGNKNIGFINLILCSQLVLIVSLVSVEYIRSIIMVHISVRINIFIISDFLFKLMKLPISFFDVKLTGDLTQRIRDHKRIEDFFTNYLLTSIFSFFSVLVLGGTLLYYNSTIFLIVFLGTAIEFVLVLSSLKRRRYLNNKLFSRLTSEQNILIELITGMQEIKLNNIERMKRWQWQKIQAAIFKTNLKIVSLKQLQHGGSRLIGQLQIILTTFIAAKAVIDGDMTIGVMMAIIYILGQMSAPIYDLIDFIYAFQDAKISLERLGEIHLKKDEEDENLPSIFSSDIENKEITFNNVSFCYPGQTRSVLENLSLKIPSGKLTAIVGTSGSGKTTLLKLILKFYSPQKGLITIDKNNLDDLDSAEWRSKCGVVMQDGFIFADTIARNIALEENINENHLRNAINLANCNDFICALPLEHNTKIGQDGIGLSQGQTQRLLIARAIYKHPDVILFDEATNALDANNEKVIINNLNQFFKGRTVVVVAHRLSTVKNADQIIVMEKGKIIEQGNHASLTTKRSAYYELVKNQLELAN